MKSPTPDEIRAILGARERLERRIALLKGMTIEEQLHILSHALETLPDGHPLKARITKALENLADAALGAVDTDEKQAIATELTDVTIEARKLIQ